MQAWKEMKAKSSGQKLRRLGGKAVFRLRAEIGRGEGEYSFPASLGGARFRTPD
jgi:hypothetical protein